jgi:MFS family permease
MAGGGRQEAPAAHIEADQAHIEDHSAAAGFRNPEVWVLATAYFGFIMGLYGVDFWVPSLVKASGVSSPTAIGWITAIPYAAAVLCMIYTSRSSDLQRERR